MLPTILKHLSATNDEQGDRFRQDVKIMEECYSGRFDVHMMSEYCWSIKHVSSKVEQTRI